jgi:two-component system response regulator YesN
MKTYEIAYKVGYDNPTYFSTLFKRFAGMTVSQYREAFGPKP